MLIFFSVQVFPQCYPGWERCVELYNKGKYDKALMACEKNMLCDQPEEQAGALQCMMNIYRDKLRDDSFYFECKKKLVRLGYEYPTGYRTIYTDVEGWEYEPPRVDLYDMSRELCCELYYKGEFDSALHYFDAYASHYDEKGWCAVGKEHNGLYDDLLWTRLYFAVYKSDSAFGRITSKLYGDRDESDLDGNRTRLAVFCFYDIFHERYPGYRRGQLLSELADNLEFSSSWYQGMRLMTHVKNMNVYVTIDQPGADVSDTLEFIRDQFRQTLLFKCIAYKDMIAHDSLVSVEGWLSDGGGEVVLYGPDRTFYLDGFPALEESMKHKTVTVCGQLVAVPGKNKNNYWNYGSALLFPHEQFKWIVKNPSLKIPN